MIPIWRRVGFGIIAAMTSCLSLAHGEHGPIDPNIRVENPIEAVGTPYGRMGSSREIKGTLDIDLADGMRFLPARVSLTQGETIRIRIRNSSREVHVFMLGTVESIAERAAYMAAGSGAVADSMSSRRILPGQTAELIWEFTTPGVFGIACLMPGHAEAGMRGELTVESKAASP